MPMRMTGINSGLDTESIIQELVAARRTKIDKKTKEQTKLSWKQDAWKELNDKVKKLYSGTLSNLRYQSSFAKKTTKVSDSSIADVITGDNAMLSVQTLKVKKMAKTGYLTGAELSAKDGEKVTAGTLLKDLDLKDADGNSVGGLAVGSKFTVTVGGKAKEITITDDMTIGKLTTQLAQAGLNANFDPSTQRFFIGAKESGKDADFSFTAADGDADGLKALEVLGFTGAGASKVAGQDAEIELNGATFKSKENTFNINGLTITAKAETGDKEVILTTETDTSGIYDMVKNFIKEYSELINEMDKLYNAESSKGYEPLTDDEKENMSDAEIEKWETKIKDSLLRRDSNLNSITSAFKEIMSSGFEVNGKKMYLYDFGIETLGYFNAADNEKNAYHIKGDADDSAFGNEANKLQAMISSDPDAVMSFFTQLSQKLYGKITEMTSSVKDYRSYGNIYDDLKMKSDYNDYTSKIKAQEEKLQAYEDKWYKKFSAMETALAKMQSNSSAIAGLLGGGVS